MSIIIIDDGTFNMKVGNAGDAAPNHIFVDRLGKMKRARFSFGGPPVAEDFVSRRATKLKPVLDMKYPIEHGVITNFDGMKKIWEHCFTDFEDPDRPVVLIDVALDPRPVRERMAALMFDYFEVPSLFIGSAATLSMFSMGIPTGVLVEIGDGVTSVVPIHNKRAIPQAIINTCKAGSVISEAFFNAVQASREMGWNPDKAREEKEKLCYVAVDPAAERAKPEASLKKNIDFGGVTVDVGRQRFEVLETFFEGEDSLQKHVFNSIMKCDAAIRPTLFSNIVITGGSSQFAGMKERLQKEVAALAPGTAVKVTCSPNPNYSAWVGASRLVTTDSSVFVTREEYKAKGYAACEAKFWC